MPTSLSPTPLQWLESDSATKHPADIEEIYRHPPLRSSSSIPRHKKATHPARSNKDPGKAATSATSTMSKDQLHTVYALIRELAASGKKQKETQEKLRLERVKYATKLQNLQAHQSDRQIEVQELQRKLKKAITRLKTYRDHIKLLSKERKNILSSAGLMNMRPGSASNPEVTSIHGLDPPQEKPLLSNLKQHHHEALLPSDSKGMDLNGLKGDIDRLATLLNPLSGKANRAETLASHESAGTIPGKSKTESTDIGKRIVPADYPSDKCDLSNNKQSIYSPLGQSSSNRPSVQSNKDKIIPASVKSVDSTGSVSGISIPETHTESSAQPSSDLLPLLKKLRLQHHRKGRHRLSAASTSDIQQSRNIEHRDHVQTMANVGKPTSGNAISEDDDAWSAITPDYEGYELDEMLMNSRHKEADSDSTLSSDDTDRWISELEKSGDPTKGIGGRRKPESNLLVKQLLRESWKCADVTISQMNDTLDTPFCEDVATSHDVSVKISQDTPSKEHHTHPSQTTLLVYDLLLCRRRHRIKLHLKICYLVP
ncbi:hypothetical protein BKA69DRAFT_410912 [Paraphysoderma sedebokerense]|nr:hypothetical protein BKA69DRAFT_410912 [Paraphysoderma sedebokerense]